MLNRELIELAKKLIAVPGYSELPEKETEVAKVLYTELVDMGLPAELRDHAGRYNVVCEYDSGIVGPKVVLCTHLDTVPPYEMQDAFVGHIKEGKLYGRGAVDVKDILAVMAFTMKRFFSERPSICGKIQFIAVADEESGSYGMRSEIQHGYDADLTIVGEPTDLQLGIAHKGVTWLEIGFNGKSAHGSVPEKGHNAIYDANKFVWSVQKEIIPKLTKNPHPILGCASINVGRMDGGTRPTIVPEYCKVQIDRRLIPGETAAQALAELEVLLARMKQEDDAVDYYTKILLGEEKKPFPPLDSTKYEDIIDILRCAIRKVTGNNPECIALPFWTDAALPGYFTKKPAVVIGPGNIEQAHSNNEYVELTQLETAVELYYEMAVSMCTLQKDWR